MNMIHYDAFENYNIIFFRGDNFVKVLFYLNFVVVDE